MLRFKLVQRGNPANKEAAKKWYAVPKSANPLSPRALAKAATANTSTTAMEVEAVFEALSDFIPMQLQQGHTVKLPGIGSFRISFKSTGCENIEDFKPSSMIKNERLIFTPSPEFKEKIFSDLEFENDGVIADKVEYGNVAAYLKVKNGGETPEDPEEDRPEVQ